MLGATCFHSRATGFERKRVNIARRLRVRPNVLANRPIAVGWHLG